MLLVEFYHASPFQIAIPNARLVGMAAPKHIGILLHSAEGALLCYRTAVHEGISRMGQHNHPKITMSGRAMHHAMAAWESDDTSAIRKLFVEDLDSLAKAGADFFILPDNTAHIALEEPGEAFVRPCLHIAEVVGDAAIDQGYSKVGILGTRWTMEGPIYSSAFGRRGVEWAVPDAETRARIHAIIFEELCLGIFEPQSTAVFEAAIEALKKCGCDAVALVCTEIPLVISGDNSALPVLDSTRLLGKAAVEVALGERPMPVWRGGPITD